MLDRYVNGTGHFAQFQEQSIEGSSEKVNKIKILKKKETAKLSYFYHF